MPSDLGCNDFGPLNDGVEAEPGGGSSLGPAAVRAAVRPFPAAYPDPTEGAAWLAGWLIPLA
jgi:hypothetical protein